MFLSWCLIGCNNYYRFENRLSAMQLNSFALQKKKINYLATTLLFLTFLIRV